jgi:predicted MFS family arabinose efflux permease
VSQPASVAPAPPPAREPPLPPDVRARGRRLAIASHPAGMTYRTVYTEWVPTLALLGLGANEAVVGLQSAFEPLGHLLQLPVLRAVGRRSKRSLLLGGQALALVAGLPLLAYGWLHANAGPEAIAIALASLAATTAGLAVCDTVWFPLLRSYVEPERIGRFFGTLRSGWHLTLIAYFLAARGWIAAHPGSLAPLFAVGTAAGLLRIALVARLPERSERTGEPIRVRQALALLRTSPALRRYLAGVGGQGALWTGTIPFVIVLMRRVMGMSEAQVLFATVASYAGGLLSLYAWGRVVDRVGPARVFRWTSLGLAATVLALLAAREPGPFAAAWITGFFFVAAVLRAGFGVADTHVLFQLAPDDAPASTIVVATVASYVARGLAPLAVGVALERALAAGTAPIAAYQTLFAASAALHALVFLPLRRFARSADG